MLDDEGRLLGVHDEALDDAGGDDTLLGIEVRRGLVDEVDVGGHTESEDNGDTLQFSAGEVLHFLVDEVVHLEGLVDVRLELGGEEGSLDLLEEELADGTGELGGDLLGLHGDVHGGNLLAVVGLEGTGEHLTEGSLSGTVLTHHDDDFRVGELTRFDVQLEVTQGLGHLGVAVGVGLVREELLTSLTDTELQRFLTETQVLGGDVTVKEDVDTFTDRGRKGDDTVDSGLAVENADEVREIVENGQIVLYDNDVVVGTEQAADHTSGSETLLDIQEG